MFLHFVEGIPSNLLKLDVFYEELRYDQVKEQEAFTVWILSFYIYDHFHEFISNQNPVEYLFCLWYGVVW